MEKIKPKFVKEGQTVLLIPNVSRQVIENTALKKPMNQLAVLSAIAIAKSLNVILPGQIGMGNWNAGHADQEVVDLKLLVAKADHVWCVGFFAGGIRATLLQAANDLEKPITFINWDARSNGFLVETQQSFKENQEAEMAKDEGSAFAFRYLEHHEPAIEELVLSVPLDTSIIEDKNKDQIEKSEQSQEQQEKPVPLG